MEKDPLSEVYSFVERAYVRLQAGDLIDQCLEECILDPIQAMIEALILAGPQSLSALREIHSEAERRKSLVQEDVYQLLQDLGKNLKSYGVSLQLNALEAVLNLNQPQFLSVLDTQGILDDSIRLDCLQILKNTQEVLQDLLPRLQLLVELEQYLSDWIWGMAFQAARQDSLLDGAGLMPH